MRLTSTKERFFCAIVIALTCTGCASLHFTFDDYSYKNKIFVGVRADVTVVSPHWYHNWIQLIDVPFSFVLDILFLPYTIPKTQENMAKAKPIDAVCFLMRDVEFREHWVAGKIFKESEQCAGSSQWGEDYENTKLAMVPVQDPETIGGFYDAVLKTIEIKRRLGYKMIVYDVGPVPGRFIILARSTGHKKLYEPYPLWAKNPERAREMARVIVESGGKITREEYAIGEYRPYLWAYDFEDPIGTRYQAIFSISIDSSDAVAFYNRALAKYKTGDWAGAILDHTSAIQRDPDYADAYFGRALAEYMSEDFTGAIADSTLAIEHDPKNADAYYNRGIAKLHARDFTGAILDQNAALERNPHHAYAYHSRGLAKTNIGDWAGALPDYNSSIQLNPNFAPAYFGRGYAKAALEEYESAVADYSEALSRNGQFAEAYSCRGYAREQLGDLIGAQQDYQEAMKLTPPGRCLSPKDVLSRKTSPQ